MRFFELFSNTVIFELQVRRLGTLEESVQNSVHVAKFALADEVRGSQGRILLSSLGPHECTKKFC